MIDDKIIKAVAEKVEYEPKCALCQDATCIENDCGEPSECCEHIKYNLPELSVACKTWVANQEQDLMKRFIWQFAKHLGVVVGSATFWRELLTSDEAIIQAFYNAFCKEVE